jgi:hypothetical protein
MHQGVDNMWTTGQATFVSFYLARWCATRLRCLWPPAETGGSARADRPTSRMPAGSPHGWRPECQTCMAPVRVGGARRCVAAPGPPRSSR